MQRGRVRVEPAGYTETLRAHDSIAYPAGVEHPIVDVGRSEAVVYLMDVVRVDEPWA